MALFIHMKVICLIVLLSCSLLGKSQLKTTLLGHLPDKIKESSGLVYESPNSLWTINDGGHKAKVYNIDSTGEIIETYHLEELKNYDWESLYLHEGTLFIGDFGNNSNKRKKLQIHKIKLSDLKTKKTPKIKTIYFKYEDQEAFPPKKSQLIFDCESMVVLGDSIYLITKNRTEPFDGKIHVYRIPKAAGSYHATKVVEYDTKGKHKLNWWVTDAILYHHDLYLLSHNKLFKIAAFSQHPSRPEEVKILQFSHFSQKEAITCDGKGNFYMTDEKFKFLGGKFYKFYLP